MNFSYKVKVQNGEIIEGKIGAPDEGAAVEILQGKGYLVLGIERLEGDIFSVDLNKYFQRVTNKDIVIFTRQLSTLIDADMPLAEGLRTLAKQFEKPNLKKVISEISDAVEGGSSLSSALASHPKLFSSFYIKLVQSGEVSGKLHDSLIYLAEHLERSQEINSKIRGALAYPVFVVFALIAVTFIMVVYVLPQLLVIFKDVGAQDLPLTTRMLIWVTTFINNYIYYLLFLVFGSLFVGWRYIQTTTGKAVFDNFKINMPALGTVVRNLYLARISESLSTLIKSGIPILDTLHITSDLVGNVNYQKVLLDAEESVRGGGNISDVLARYKEVPPLMTSMVSIGEKTGKLDFMLGHISKFYKSESDSTIDSIATLIEPVLVLILGIGVAILVSAILLPIYNLVNVT